MLRQLDPVIFAIVCCILFIVLFMLIFSWTSCKSGKQSGYDATQKFDEEALVETSENFKGVDRIYPIRPTMLRQRPLHVAPEKVLPRPIPYQNTPQIQQGVAAPQPPRQQLIPPPPNNRQLVEPVALRNNDRMDDVDLFGRTIENSKTQEFAKSHVDSRDRNRKENNDMTVANSSSKKIGGLKGTQPLVESVKPWENVGGKKRRSPSPSSTSSPPTPHTAEPVPIPVPHPLPTISIKPSPSIPFVSLQDLKLAHVLGGGTFGQVWKGSWKGTPVAVKILSQSCQKALPSSVLSDFDSEVAMLSSLRHPNICLFMCACLDPPNRCIVTELVSRGSLWDVLRTPDLFPVGTVRVGCVPIYM